MCLSGSSASTVYSDTRDPQPTASTRLKHEEETLTDFSTLTGLNVEVVVLLDKQ